MVTLFTVSCVFDHTDNKQDLGNGFYYSGDGSESQILIDVSEDKNKTVGRTIVPGEVTAYNFDENYIIAKNRTDKDGLVVQNYWVVNKREKTDPVPLDSVEFENRLEDLGSALKLKPRE